MLLDMIAADWSPKSSLLLSNWVLNGRRKVLQGPCANDRYKGIVEARLIHGLDNNVAKYKQPTNCRELSLFSYMYETKQTCVNKLQQAYHFGYNCITPKFSFRK